MKYISEDVLRSALREAGYGNDGNLADIIDSIATEDVVPVKHGKFVVTSEKFTNSYGKKFTHYIGTCSVCGKRYGDFECSRYNYCPRCGARMDGVE